MALAPFHRRDRILFDHNSLWERRNIEGKQSSPAPLIFCSFSKWHIALHQPDNYASSHCTSRTVWFCRISAEFCRIKTQIYLATHLYWHQNHPIPPFNSLPFNTKTHPTFHLQDSLSKLTFNHKIPQDPYINHNMPNNQMFQQWQTSQNPHSSVLCPVKWYQNQWQ